MKEKFFTNTFLFDDHHQRILLGMKLRGFGKGYWNGFGGKVDVGESLVDAARREVQEECGLVVEHLEQVGLIKFASHFHHPGIFDVVNIFRARGWSGDVRETEEMRPQWFSLDAVPFAQMWPDAQLWFPWMLRGEGFVADIRVEEGDAVVSHTIQPHQYE
ncbi:MAG: hypothetical protein A3F54_00535 [Candidatus Kerfeldbacteria bacterium RIFCSPHIGHO2_12_FULL_48_17]|uniref:Oxidized purine nucleoside triphosphate hydrolase n=1 Tax=Candidatus Kerfeldbacteria bacterium RIFCSPHIGHO2_12_FULL_48_17 TaxID=1798542 RepID=A0A1G2B6S3_9BACT|nr:MAG: hypothetical protein A3F54_00535 [Candidatus Kerfeldbacteria bacterium RIFCSPHIGHO2_12_FULL_48_17]